jgi:RNA polymerase sigma factor (sigma-70 family)
VTPEAFEDLLREHTAAVLGALVRRFGSLELAEDSLQDAAAAAWRRWPQEGIPDRPGGWLLTVARNSALDTLRREARRPGLERRACGWLPGDGEPASPPPEPVADDPLLDDVLPLLLLCCHPALAPDAQVALTLRAVGGLSTTEIARAFLVPEPTVAQRLVRAKRKIAAAGIPFRLPAGAELRERVGAVLPVIYLVFNEGYSASGDTGEEGAAVRPELCAEAERLARLTRRLVPDDPEVAGLLALVLLHGARLAARTGPDGEVVAMEHQDRSHWDAGRIAEGVRLVERTLGSGPLGPYQLQAAIAALHAEAPSWSETDWPQIAALYRLLQDVAPGPMVTLNRAVAVALAHGPQVGLRLVDELAASGQLSGHHRLASVRAHLLEQLGRRAEAAAAYAEAAARTANPAERRHLAARAQACREGATR